MVRGGGNPYETGLDAKGHGLRVSWRDNCRTGGHIDDRLYGFHFTGYPEDGTDRVVFNSYGFSAWHDSLVLAALQGI